MKDTQGFYSTEKDDCEIEAKTPQPRTNYKKQKKQERNETSATKITTKSSLGTPFPVLSIFAAIVFTLEKFNHYTYGQQVKVGSDRKPLESILRKPLASAPRRLQGMMMRLQKDAFEVSYERGKDMHLPDTLSRAYLPTTEHPGGAEFKNVNAASFLPVSDSKLREIQQATAEDTTLQTLKKTIINGWPEERKSIPAEITAYFSVRDELAVQDGIIFRGQRIVIPKLPQNIT